MINNPNSFNNNNNINYNYNNNSNSKCLNFYIKKIQKINEETLKKIQELENTIETRQFKRKLREVIVKEKF